MTRAHLKFLASLADFNLGTPIKLIYKYFPLTDAGCGVLNVYTLSDCLARVQIGRVLIMTIILFS